MMETKNDSNNIYEIPQVNTKIIKATKKLLPNDEIIRQLSNVFKPLSDTTRLKIILALLENELCVCDICHVVGLGQSAVSHQLRVLRSANLVKYRKSGKLVYYSIVDNHVSFIIKLSLEHIKHTKNPL